MQKTLAELAQLPTRSSIASASSSCRIAGEFIFVNAVTRLRLDLTNYASFGVLSFAFASSGIGCSPRHHGDFARRGWLLHVLARRKAAGSTRTVSVPNCRAQLARPDVTDFEVSPPVRRTMTPRSTEESREAASRTYTQSVAVHEGSDQLGAHGTHADIKKIKRVVQGIVDQILNEETSLIGLTTLRDYDEYTFTHSVNVCIFSVALGRRLGLTKLQLYDLGLAALMHDIGKSRIPVESFTRAEQLDRRRMAPHRRASVARRAHAVSDARPARRLPYRAMIVAYEHHMKR